MRLNPAVAATGTYPFVRLAEAKARVAASGVTMIDFGIGEPREETPEFIREALCAAVDDEPISVYPTAVGLPELREAIAGWVGRRFGAVVDPATEVIPTLGSKEAIYALAQVVGRPGDAIAVPTPGYPVPERSALIAGLEAIELELDAAHGWLPDLDAVPWQRIAVLWLASPGNPTGAVAPLAYLEEAAARCRAHDVWLACDEAYVELWFEGEPPPSALQLHDRRNVVSFHSLSKRSSMPGYRSGFMAGDAELIAVMKRVRPNMGTSPQRFVQRASIAAWNDDAHVVAVRERYAAKRAVLLPALLAAGLVEAGGPASFFLWLRVPGDGDDEAFAARWLERGIVMTPGSYLGAGAGHVRVALVPTPEECARAAAILRAGL
ncbi:MAG: aminotransferase class I/II-fold pyridoxal phosphate-dependent enzyme [Solirubrobacterales bacterium]|nr:aminotransferase class I/II-fold pyridoxal phosphate-dependent enzyme [Solirubrobacterales bacterium]